MKFFLDLVSMILGASLLVASPFALANDSSDEKCDSQLSLPPVEMSVARDIKRARIRVMRTTLLFYRGALPTAAMVADAKVMNVEFVIGPADASGTVVAIVSHLGLDHDELGSYLPADIAPKSERVLGGTRYDAGNHLNSDIYADRQGLVVQNQYFGDAFELINE